MDPSCNIASKIRFKEYCKLFIETYWYTETWQVHQMKPNFEKIQIKKCFYTKIWLLKPSMLTKKNYHKYSWSGLMWSLIENIIIQLMWPGFTSPKSQVQLLFWYHSINFISFSLSLSDPIKHIPLYLARIFHDNKLTNFVHLQRNPWQPIDYSRPFTKKSLAKLIRTCFSITDFFDRLARN